MLRDGEEPTQLHNNCSGKHAAMLAFAKHIGENIERISRRKIESRNGFYAALLILQTDWTRLTLRSASTATRTRILLCPCRRWRRVLSISSGRQNFPKSRKMPYPGPHRRCNDTAFPNS